jgi:hypothetical protein
MPQGMNEPIYVGCYELGDKAVLFRPLTFRPSNFEFVSNFEFRTSNF